MGEFVTGAQMASDIMDVLVSWGIPRHAKVIDVHISADAPVIVTCTFYPTTPDGGLERSGDALKEVTKRFRLIAAED